jgi:hypothetical protein
VGEIALITTRPMFALRVEQREGALEVRVVEALAFDAHGKVGRCLAYDLGMFAHRFCRIKAVGYDLV